MELQSASSRSSSRELLLKEKSKYVAKLEQQRKQEQLVEWRKRLHQNELRIEDAPDFVKRDKDAILAAVKVDPHAFSHAHEYLKHDKDVFLTALKHSPHDSHRLFKHAHLSLKKDKEVVLAAIRKDSRSFEFAHKCLQSDKDFVLLLVKQSGALLRYAHDSLRNDKEVVLPAVQQDRRSFQFANASLKGDKEVVLAAMKMLSLESHTRKKNEEDELSTRKNDKRDLLKNDYHESDNLQFAHGPSVVKQESRNLQSELEFL